MSLLICGCLAREVLQCILLLIEFIEILGKEKLDVALMLIESDLKLNDLATLGDRKSVV